MCFSNVCFSTVLFSRKWELPAYISSDEDEPDVCVLCSDPKNDPVQFGKLLSIGPYKVHQFCCVSSMWIHKIRLFKSDLFMDFHKSFFIRSC